MARILIVDDSPMVRKFHSFILSALGYQVTQAEDGYLALETLLGGDYDLVITDVNMPRMDGLHFIKELRAIPHCQATPVIIVSTQEHLADVEQGMAVGANMYYIKPTDPEKLIAGVRTLLTAQGKEA